VFHKTPSFSSYRTVLLHYGTPAMDWGGNACNGADKDLSGNYRLMLAKVATDEQVGCIAADSLEGIPRLHRIVTRV
jgi:hypothetical protein